jgi:lactoylglutathione lyase
VKANFAYTGIEIRDLERSIKFYTENLDMKLVRRSKIPETNGEIAELRSPDGHQLLELNWYAGHNRYRSGDELDHLAFDVEDVDKALAQLKAQGVEVAMEPFDEGEGRLAFVKDPDGIWIELTGSRKKTEFS